MGVSIINLLVPTSLGSMIPMLVVSIELTSFTWWGFSICKQLKGMETPEELKVLACV